MEIEKLIEREGKWIWIKKDVQKARLGSVSFDYPSRRREKVMKPDKRREDHRRFYRKKRDACIDRPLDLSKDGINR